MDLGEIEASLVHSEFQAHWGCMEKLSQNIKLKKKIEDLKT